MKIKQLQIYFHTRAKPLNRQGAKVAMIQKVKNAHTFTDASAP